MPNLFRGGVCGLSTMICDRLDKPFCRFGSTQKRRVHQRACDRQDRDGAELAEMVRLHDKGRPGLSLIAVQGDRHQVSTSHPVQPVVSEIVSQASASARVAAVSLSRSRRAWRAHSSAKPWARVSGTQI